LDCKDRVKIDLHIHSNASDGTLSPADIISTARALELGAIAITDHDTLEGSKEAQRLGIPASIGFLTGVEISASPPPSVAPYTSSLHILGYGLDLDNDELNQVLTVLQHARKNRNPAILTRLSQLGLPIDLEEVHQAVENGQIGRPHIARVMVKKGYVPTINDAFDHYLGHGKPAYVEKYRISCRKAIEIILGAGGVPVLAHPLLLGLPDNDRLDELVRALGEMGLQGIEVYYPEHPAEAVVHYEHLARKHQLLMTGGTDFHGALIPQIQMGIGTGNFHVPYRLYEKLLERLGVLATGHPV
jgi:predicted metal-dependent phosphoesterase TrpH